MRYRLRYGRQGRMRFLSAHDEAPVLERAARRGGLPLRYSEGYTPRPKISFGSGLPVGYGSDVELLDLGLTEELPPPEVVTRYNAGLPEGIVVHAAVPLPSKAISLGALIEAAAYRVSCNDPWLAEGMARFIELDSYEISKPHKGGAKTDDLRAGVFELTMDAGGFDVVCAIQPRSIRPSDVVDAAARLVGETAGRVDVIRTALLRRQGDGFVEIDEHTNELKVAS